MNPASFLSEQKGFYNLAPKKKHEGRKQTNKKKLAFLGKDA